MRSTYMLSLALLLLAGTAHGHSAAQHSVRLVEFSPPLPAPSFSLPALDEGSVNLEDYRGRFVLLNFWATWCPPCLEEMPSMERLSHRLEDHRFAVLAVSLDEEGAAAVAPFIERLEVTFGVALDPHSKVGTLYGANELPTTFLIDPLGRVIAAAKGARDWASENILDFLLERVERGNAK